MGLDGGVVLGFGGICVRRLYITPYIPLLVTIQLLVYTQLVEVGEFQKKSEFSYLKKCVSYR